MYARKIQMKQNAQQVRSVILALIMAGAAGAGLAGAGTTAQSDTWLKVNVDAGADPSRFPTPPCQTALRIRT